MEIKIVRADGVVIGTSILQNGEHVPIQVFLSWGDVGKLALEKHGYDVLRTVNANLNKKRGHK
jgi:hypothetical protein